MIVFVFISMQSIAEFDLKAIRYDVKSPLCHELSLATPPHDRISFNFRSEQEAQEWATVVMSSLREAHRVAICSRTEERLLPPQPLASQSHAPMPCTEEVCAELVSAIEAGDVRGASVCASSLAKQRASLSIQPSRRNYTDGEISLAVVVEDASSSCCVTVKVFPHSSVSALKQQVFTDYGFHPRVQRWVIGQSLCSDHRSLASYGVQRDGDTAFLYLISARQARLNRGVYQQDQESALIIRPKSNPHQEAITNGPAPVNTVSRPYSTLPTRLHNSHNTLSNSAGGTESADRPEGYTVPGNYRPDALELRRIQQEKEAVRQYHQARETERRENFARLVQMDGQDLVPNPERVECRICYVELDPGEGDYERWLQRGLSVAESRCEGSYHCATTDCPGWCVYEDTVNTFNCPVCKKHNCLLCKTLVNSGEAMHCPQCGIIVQKKEGCDWLRCTVCHMEICWVTRGPRWGPKVRAL
ncbi:hypothetical protein DNTS_017628 [Danionella cerebrum]|uniref:RING-type domain-containing protein n=1 Tax=Danionella cerebrum TaxID=2873325 RepID=A0A553PE61_9TELE|nr:hypothetical protein DNTS_017628 [Danionella translucida]